MTGRESARRFHFLRELASGAFGSVYLCKVVHSDGFSRLAAVKLLKTQWADNEEVVHRIRDEARLLGLLRHRNIVDVMDLTAIDGRTAVVMEYLEAVDFRAVTQSLLRVSGQIPPKAALEAMSMVAGALDAAYNRPPIPGEKPLRVIHRDIKPSNIMIDETGMVKVLDFGIARSEIDGRESHTRELQFGSVDYMAPERLFFEPETPSSDIYSLSATLYEVLALDKLGKARGSPERHATHLADRLSFLRAQLALSGSAAIELEALLRSGLSFEHEGRPTAAAFFQRARALSRLMEGEDLSDWAERTLPGLIQEAASSPATEGSLVSEVLMEDSQVFALEAAPPPDPGRAESVRRGALAELADDEAFFPSPATGAPRRMPTPDPFASDALDDWEDIPTNVLGATPSRESTPPPDGRRYTGDPIEEARSMLMDTPDPGALFSFDAPLPTDEQPTRPYVSGMTIIPDDDFGGPPAPTLEPLLTSEQAALSELEPESAFAAASAPEPTTAQSKRAGYRGWMLAGGVMACFFAVVLVIGLASAAFALDVGGIRTTLLAPEPVTSPEGLQGIDRTAEPEVERVETEPSDARAEVVGGIIFVSLDERTQKLKVRCTGAASSGQLEAHLDHEAAEQCMVTAILQSRERLSTVLETVSEGRYSCFADGVETCTRE